MLNRKTYILIIALIIIKDATTKIVCVEDELSRNTPLIGGFKQHTNLKHHMVEKATEAANKEVNKKKQFGNNIHLITCLKSAHSQLVNGMNWKLHVIFTETECKLNELKIENASRKNIEENCDLNESVQKDCLVSMYNAFGSEEFRFK